MEDDASVRKLVELIFSKQCNISETTTAAVPITSCLLANDFPQKFQDVLLMKYMIFNNEWRREIYSCSNCMWSSKEHYLEVVIFACLTEYKCYQNVFESFISMCALLKLFNDVILITTGMDFTDLNTDVFMVVYDSVMKSTFYKQGGLQNLVEYIHGHRYLSWKWKLNDLVSTDEKTKNKIQKDIKKKHEKEYTGRCFPQTETDLIEMGKTSTNLVQKVISSKSVKHHTFPNNPNMIKSLLEASRNEEKIIKATAVFVDLDVASQGCSSLNSDSKVDYTIDHTSTSNNEETAEISEKERIIEAAAEFLGLDEASQGCSSSNSDLKTDYTINRTLTLKNEEIEEESEKERIIEATAKLVDLAVATNGCSRSSSDSKTSYTINNTSTFKNEKMAEESENERILEAEFVDLDVTSQGCSISSSDLKTDHTSTSKNEKMAEESEREGIIDANVVFADLDAISRVCSSLNSDLKANPRINQNMDSTQYENIIQAVIRHNHTRSSSHTNSDDPIQKEADGILDHFKNTIKSLAAVLDDYEKV